MQELIAEAATMGLALSCRQIATFERYQQLLQEWNRRISLTTVDDPAQVRVRHFLDSLSCAMVTGDLDGQRLVDVGTGAGFPGLPLKILYPRLQLTLVESVTKKVRFLSLVLEELSIADVQVLDARAETVGQDRAYRASYDWAVARAVAPLNVLLEYLLPLCRIGGRALAMKSDRAQAEAEAAAKAIEVLGGAAPRFYPVRLPGRDETSYLVAIQKRVPTPDAYPRRPGLPAKRSL
ncbi:MAG TPA: 16S rRNA (guanine(527)-N(7))-methyltransferase RsmG [Candidatus Binatia bacterium]|nr:16S rRNA (guanine(527)-N(7))-methyltransferase RsmG [Candidatus Binatia bacterium]